MTRRIGILGGTFDPIHCGHLDLAAAVQQNLSLSSLIFLPSHVPPHRPQPVASPFHRFAMVSIAVSRRPEWQASDLELGDAAPSYTSSTLRRFHATGHSPTELVFIVGADAFAEIASWNDYPRILDGAHFAVVSRPGHAVRELPRLLPQLAQRMMSAPAQLSDTGQTAIILIEASTADVSATAIRQRLAQGRSITGMVDPGVEQHIERHGLYSPSSPGQHATTDSRGPTAGRLHD